MSLTRSHVATTGENHTLQYVACTCGWSCTRESREEAMAAASVHALKHRRKER